MILKKFIVGIFLSVLSFTAASAQESYNRLIFEGNKSFNQKDFETSSTKFREAAKLKNQDFASHYNLANSLYKSEKYEEAKAEYELAKKYAQTDADRMASSYNLGNVYMKTNQPEKAAEFYKQSLKKDPYNEQIRKNYEIAMLKEKEKQNKQQQDQQKSGGGGNGDNKDQNQNSKDGKNPQGGNGNSQQKQDNNGQGNQNKPDPNQMPKDLQDAIMNRVSDKERETARRILNKNSYSMPESNEKDW